ncbi:hypothetical protein D3C84_617790 [compost metagenome]
MPRQTQALSQSGFIGQVHFDFIGRTGTTAEIRTGDVIDPHQARGTFCQRDQLAFQDGGRRRQGIGFGCEHLDAHVVEHLGPGIGAGGRRCCHLEQLCAQVTVQVHGFDHPPHPITELLAQVTSRKVIGRPRLLLDQGEKIFGARLVNQVVPGFHSEGPQSGRLVAPPLGVVRHGPLIDRSIGDGGIDLLGIQAYRAPVVLVGDTIGVREVFHIEPCPRHEARVIGTRYHAWNLGERVLHQVQ